MSKVIQVMAPFIWVNPFDATFQHDLMRILKKWRGESFISLEKKPTPAHQQNNEFCYVLGESDNGIPVYFIGPGGIYSPKLKAFKGSRKKISDLYKEWLKIGPTPRGHEGKGPSKLIHG